MTSPSAEPLARASPSLSETPRAREGEEEEKEDEEERAKRAEAEEDRDEEERAKRAEAREDQDEYARATDSITSSDVHGDLDWPDIHAPRLPSKFVATFLWDLPRRSDATVRDADADAPADTNADAETARQKTRDVYRRAADALRAAFLAAGVCDASSCEVRRDRNVRRARLPLAGVGRADTDEPDDVFSRSLGPFYAVVRVRRWNDLELRDAVLASGRRAVPVPGFYEDEPLEIRVNVDRDRDRGPRSRSSGGGTSSRSGFPRFRRDSSRGRGRVATFAPVRLGDSPIPPTLRRGGLRRRGITRGGFDRDGTVRRRARTKARDARGMAPHGTPAGHDCRTPARTRGTVRDVRCVRRPEPGTESVGKGLSTPRTENREPRTGNRAEPILPLVLPAAGPKTSRDA